MFSKMMVRAQSVITWLLKKFREIQFKRILQHIWEWIKGLNRKSSIDPGDENESCGTPPSPKKPPIIDVKTPIQLPDEYKDYKKWCGKEREFLKLRLGILVSAKYVHWQTLRAFLRRIRDYGTYEFSGNAKIYLFCINPVKVIVETFGQFGISVDEQTVLEIMQDLIPRQWAGMMLSFEHNTIRAKLDKKLSEVVDAVYAKINVASAA